LNDDAPLNEKEIALIQKLNDFSVAVAQAGVDYSPSGIANYCYELTKEFNQFYHDYSILNADTEAEKITRLVLAKNVAKVIKNGMALLGIEVPARMWKLTILSPRATSKTTAVSTSTSTMRRASE